MQLGRIERHGLHVVVGVKVEDVQLRLHQQRPVGVGLAVDARQPAPAVDRGDDLVDVPDDVLAADGDKGLRAKAEQRRFVEKDHHPGAKRAQSGHLPHRS